MAEGQSSPQWDCKLALVGEGGVGKSCLLRALRGEPFRDSTATSGIEIHPLILPHPQRSGVNLRLHAWDFGGQDFYHATHQFFLSDEAVCLVAWNARYGVAQGNLEYWLEAVQGRAPHAPVLVVATWIDDCKKQPELPPALRKRFSQIAGFYKVSNKTGAGIDELKKALAETAAGLPGMGEAWPAAWQTARQRLQSLPEAWIHLTLLQKLMQENGVPAQSVEPLTRRLHQVGEILYRVDDPQLNDLVLLKPAWVSARISQAIENEEVAKHGGLLTRANMETLWAGLDPLLRRYLLRLMERFDLAYPVLNSRGEWEASLVVECLPHEQPAELPGWDALARQAGCSELAILYKFNKLPPGIPSWVIAREHRFATGCCWRYGALLADGGQLALLQAEPSGELELRVRGRFPQNLSFFLRLKDSLDFTLERYQDIQVERHVPCPGHPPGEDDCSYQFSYEALLRANAAGAVDVRCERSGQPVPLALLLTGEKAGDLQKSLAEIKAGQQRIEATQWRHFQAETRRDQALAEVDCPNVFTLSRKKAGALEKALRGEKLVLQLYCQAEGRWHPTLQGGRYEFDCPPDWLRVTGRYLMYMTWVLRLVVPQVGGVLQGLDPAYAAQVSQEVKLMEDLVKAIPDLKESEAMHLADKVAQGEPPGQVYGPALRAIRKLLDELDAHQQWGGLRKVVTPEGVTWLCAEHDRPATREAAWQRQVEAAEQERQRRQQSKPVEAAVQPPAAKPAEAVKQPTPRPQPPAPVQQKEPAQVRQAPAPFSKIALASGIDLVFCHVPAGEFWMGSDKSKDSQASDDEMPQHKVYLDEYWIGKSSITVAQFAAFVKSSNYQTEPEKKKDAHTWRTPRGGGSGISGKENHPVVCVTWNDAVAFCQWAGQVSKQKIRLPTEAEWEKAARGTDGRIYPWGNEAPTKENKRCNFDGSGIGDTTPVGQFSPRGDSPYGCVDMAGNVWDWVNDWYDENYYKNAPARNPSGPSSGQYHVLRGGSWNYRGNLVRSAFRFVRAPDYWNYYDGFRVVRSP